MDTTSTRQEIILITKAVFSSRKFGKTDDARYDQLTAKEELQSVIRKGLLPFLLPEIIEINPENTLHLWEMSDDSLFVELKPDKTNLEFEMQFSIDPSSFLSVQTLS